ncbi:MAG: DUF2325 domain-containing protein [Desulfobacterales bacterium]|nr:DUF2325 domain-containing protein [Desulfobacterales bacterium]
METPGNDIMSHIDLKPDGNPFLPAEPVKADCDDNCSRLRSWMMHRYFKCPVVGTCLSLEEQKKILKKMGYSIKNRSAHEIHGIFVHSLSDKNALSKRIDAYLHRKFEHKISKFSSLDRSLFLDVWKTNFQKGEIAGLLWVAATRPDLKTDDIKSIFGDVHMQMHLNAAWNEKARQRLSFQEKENRKLKELLQQESAIRRTLKKENKSLKKDMDESRKGYAFFEKEKVKIEKKLFELNDNSEFFDLQAENMELRVNVRKLSDEVSGYKKWMADLQDQNNKLLGDIDRQREINDHFKKEMERDIIRISAMNRCNEICPSFDLCRKRILIVGGIVKIKDRYKKLIEENGGIFEYHDGYMNGGTKGLKKQIRRADMVLCPVNCNSHNACSVAKKIGKKYNRQVHMLAGSGLSAISQALMESQKSANLGT